MRCDSSGAHRRHAARAAEAAAGAAGGGDGGGGGGSGGGPLPSGSCVGPVALSYQAVTSQASLEGIMVD